MKTFVRKSGVFATALLMLNLFFAQVAFTQITTPAANAGTGADATGVGTVTWSAPGNALSDDNNFATANLNNSTSHYLQATNYGFGIPAGATISGITVTIGRFGTTGVGSDVRDNVVRLIKNGSIVGNNLAATGTDWPASEAVATYGSSLSGVWGTTLSAADVNANNFGVALAVNSSNTRTASVDYIKISVTYSGGTYKSLLSAPNVGSSTWCAGETRTVSVTVKNTGTFPWTDGAGGVPDFNIGVKWDGDPDYLIRTDALGLTPADAARTYSFVVTAPAAGSNHLTFDVVYEGISWFGDNGGGVGTGNVKLISSLLTINALPTISNAGANQAKCNNGGFTLAGNSPTIGTGLWSVVSGTATITTPSSRTSGVTGVPAGTSATLRWTISNNPCTPSTDDVVLTNSATPTTAVAGGDQTNCNNGGFTITANTPSVGTGAWSVVNGTASVSTPTSPTSGVTGVPVGTSATLRWTISNNPCTASTDDVVLTNNSNTTTANAGADQVKCNTSTFTLAGNTAIAGTGLWSVVSGTAIITTPTSATSGITGVPVGTSATLRWTITNAPCASTTDDVILTNNGTPTTANAGSNQANCNNGNFTLAGNTASVGTGAWSVVGGTATITNSASPVSGVTGVPPGTSATLRWTISNTPCTPSTDDVVLTNNSNPTTASAGGDQVKCNTGTFTLAGNTATVGTGSWSVVSGTATITTPSSPVSGVTSVPAGTSATLRWTISNNPCTPSADDVVLTNNNVQPTPANAGPNQANCNNGSFTLAGNTPGVGTGAWSVVGGTATITAPTSPGSGVTGVPSGTSATLRWTTTNAACTSTDDVVLANNPNPTTAIAGANQVKCNTTTFTLTGNTATIGTGTWTLVSGTAVITTPASPTSGVTGVPVGTSATLRWTISNNPCTPSTDDVVLTNSATPTTANAGSNQTNCNNGSFTLAANTPSVGTGAWSVVSGTATILSPSSPNSGVTGVPVGTNATVRWTISNNPCTATTDDVVLTNNAAPTSVTVTPASSAICTGSVANLSGSASITSTTPATLLTENFNGTPSFTVAGSNSGGGTAFSQQSSGYLAGLTTITNNVDASKFMIAVAASFGSATTNSTLTSSVLNTNGYTSLNLGFNHSFAKIGSSSASVEVSTNGGGSWTTVKTYAATQGANNNFVADNINLNAYINQSNLRIRFNTSLIVTFATAWWAIDNLVINGTTASVPQFSWTASPAAVLPNTANISVSPTVNTTYTLTATDPATGCSAVATPVLVTVYPKPTLNTLPNVTRNTGDDGTGDCSAVYNWTHPVVNTACPTTLTIAYTAGSPVPPTFPTGGTVTAGAPSSAAFFTGVTIATYTATDQNGNFVNTSFTVTVTDDELPSITCSADVSVPNITGSCEATVNLTAPATADNCGVAAGSPSNNHPSNVYPIGTTNVTWTVTDVNGNSKTCVQKVTVTDTELPTITCAANVNVNNDQGLCSKDVTLTAPSTHDNCPGTITTATRSDAPLTLADPYPVGTTTITWKVTDAAGNSATCSQTVTVTDNEKPVIICPAPITTTTDPAASYATIVLPQPPASDVTDNCGVASVIPTGVPAMNHFPIGPTIVTWTVTDIHGNSIFCNQTIIVNDIIDPSISSNPPISIFNTLANCDGATPVTYPAASDNSGHVTVSSNYAGLPTPSVDPVTPLLVPGVVFPVGQTTITWTAIDPSLNDSWSTQLVTVTDNELPTIACPANISQNNDPGLCTAVINLGTPVTADNCGVASVSNDHPSNVYPVGVTTVTWTVTDIHGNINTCTQTITVTDNVIPVIVAPANVDVYSDHGLCSANMNAGTATATDNCGVGTPTGTRSDALALSAPYPVGTTTITWKVADIHGNNAIDVTQTVTVTDNEQPVISNTPGNILVNNDAGNCGAVVTWTVPGAIDNCAVATFVSNHAPGDVFSVGSTAVTYTATDIHGNIETSSFTVTVTDNELPVINNTPVNIVINNDPGNCSAVATWTGPIATDNCAVATFTSNHAPGDVFPVGLTNVTYTANDIHGNVQTSSFTVKVTDNELPVITNTPGNISINNDLGSCSAVATWIQPQAADNCAIATLVSNHATGDAFPVGSTIVTYTATDIHGNMVISSFTVTVTDSELPVITNTPANIAINNDLGNCGAVATWTEPIATDNCAVYSFTSDHAPGDAFPVGLTTVTYTAEDIHGNIQTSFFTVTVTDNEKPTITCPANITLNCQDNNTSATTGIATAMDNCTAVVNIVITESETSTYNTDPSNVLHYNYVITRTWKATDAVGNFSTCDQVITVHDVTNPVIICPGDVTVNCQDNNSSTATGVASGTDNCSPVTISQSDASTQNASTTNAGHYNYTIARTWRATDVAGNYSECVQTITVQDINNPVITCPADVIVNCQDNKSSSATGVATGTDNCSPVTITQSDVSTQNGSINNAGYYNYTITRTWRATDVTGNFSECVQTITVQDVTQPVITCPGNVTINCQDNSSSASTGVATATDNCSPVTITQSDVSTQDANDANAGHYNYTINRTWRATDVTGNFSECVQTITIHDITNPVITCPGNVTVNCQDNNSSTATGIATGTDNCSPVTIIESNASTQDANVANAGHYNYTITRTWRATDVTGNYTECVQTITVHDITAPLIVCPFNATVDCQDDNTSAATGVANGADNCSAVAITQSDISTQDANIANAGHYNYTITRTWRATDVTGNYSECVQTITVLDVTNPVITCPGDVTVNCQDNNSSTATGVATGTDNCSPVAITESDVSTQDANVANAGHYNYTITRTWRATDITGNFTECVQIITIKDITAPLITCPANTTVNCQDNNTSAATGTATATDNCAPVANIAITQSETSTYTSDPFNVLHYNYVITRTWKATDIAGNYSTCQQTITVHDVTAPSFTRPVNITIYTSATCTYDAGVNATGDVSNESDNCAPGLQATFTDVVTNGPCQGTKVITRTWHLVDISGNAAADQVQTITVSDNTAPTFTRPANKTIYVNAGCAYDATVAATGDVTNEADNCSTGLQATFTDVVTNGACQGSKIITRTWHLVDNCGNAAADQVQIITVSDNIAPIISTCASSVTVVPNYTNCTSKLLDYRSSVVAGDNCSTVTLTQSPAVGTALPLGANTVTITATDACGNSSNCSFTVTVNKTLDVTVANSNPQLYYGYTLDQSTVIKGTPTGGVGPYKVVITMDRVLSCNVVNSTGDEVWANGTGTSSSTGTTCPASGSGSIPVSTALNVPVGGSYSVTATLLANAVFTVTITDVNGCAVSKTTTVYSEDARCFAGNSGNVKVKICHRTGDKNDPCHEICVAESAVQAHLAHGDFLGTCTTGCIAPPPPPVTRAAVAPTFVPTLEAKVIPNPTTTFFTVVIKGRDASPVTVRVMDVYGKVIQVNQKIGAFSTLRMGDRWLSGTYFIEVMQGSEKKVLKAVKAK